MDLEIIELLSLGTSNINHIRSTETEIVDLKQKGEHKWNALLDYLETYCQNAEMKIIEIENGKVWLVSK